MSRNKIDLTFKDDNDDDDDAEYLDDNDQDDDDELFDTYSDHSHDFDNKKDIVVESREKGKDLKQADAELLLGLATQASTGIVLTDKSSQESSSISSSRNNDNSHDRRHLSAPQCSLHRSTDDVIENKRDEDKQSQRASKLKLKISKKRASQLSTEESTTNNITIMDGTNNTTSQSSSSSTPIKRKKKKRKVTESPTNKPSNRVTSNTPPQKNNSIQLTATGSSLQSSTNNEINVRVNIESNGMSTPPLQRSPIPKSSEIKPMSNSTPPVKGTITPKSSETKSVASSSTPQSIRKKKKKTFQEQVYDHMWKSMKPMTLKSMAQTFRTSDTALHHLMLSLTDKGMVIEKKTKKKSIFWANTEYKNPSNKSSSEECTEVERQQAKEELEKYTLIHNNLQNQLSNLLKEATNEELVDKIQQSQQKLEKVQQIVQQTKDRINSNNKEKQSTKNLGTKFNAMRKEWKNRKEKCTDFCYNLSDAMEKKPKDIFKLLDIETDEDYNVKLPPPLQLDDQHSNRMQNRKR